MILPAGIARDGSGGIYVTNPSTNTVAIYLPDATGNVSPFAIIGGSKTRLANPTGIALDRNGNIYVLNSATAAITVYASVDLRVVSATARSLTILDPLGTGLLNLPPIAVIAGLKRSLNSLLPSPWTEAATSMSQISWAAPF